MIKKSFVALAALLCGSIAFAAPGAYTEWFADAVASHPTNWSTSDKVDGAVAVTTDAAVTYTAAAPESAYAKQTITVTSEPLDELPDTDDTSLTGARFAFGVAQLEGDANPAVYVLAKVDGTATWTKTTAPVGNDNDGAATAVEVTYDKPGQTFTVAGVDTVFTSLLANSDDWTTTTFVGNGSVNALVGEKAGVGVAMIDGVGYNTIEEAIEAAGETKTIDLTADVTLPTGVAAYKINTNGFALNTPEGYFSTVDGATVTVAATTGTTTEASMIWDRDFTTGRVDANGNNWSAYKPTGVTATATGVTISTGGGISMVVRTKNPTGLSGKATVIFRAKNIALPSSGSAAALAKLKQGSTTLGAAVKNVDGVGHYTRIWGGNLDWNSRRDKSMVLAPQDVEQTYVLTYEYDAGQTKGTYFYRVDGARTVTKLWQEGGLEAGGLNGFNEISILGEWNGNSCNGATLTGLAIFEGNRLTEEAIANFDWSSPAPNKASYSAADPSQVYYGYIPSTAKTIWPDLTLNDIKDKPFTGVMNGNWVAADAGANDGKISFWSDVVPTVEKTFSGDSVILDFKHPSTDKYVRVTLTDAAEGVQAVAVAGTTKGGTNSTLATDDNTGNYGIKVLRVLEGVAQIGSEQYATLADAIAAAGAPAAEAPVTITLLKQVAEAVTIPANVIVEMTADNKTTGAISGAGVLRLVGEGFGGAATQIMPKPTFGDWTGAVEVKDWHCARPGEAGNIFKVSNYANANSSLVFNGYKGYFHYEGSPYTVKSVQIVGDGLEQEGSFSGTRNIMIKAQTISGDGPIVCGLGAGNSANFSLVGDASAYAGSVSATSNYRMVFAGAEDDALPSHQNQSIAIGLTATVTIADGKTWTAANGVQVYGTLKKVGSLGTNTKFKGSGEVIYEKTGGTTQIDEFTDGTTGFNESAWTGTVTFRNFPEHAKNHIGLGVFGNDNSKIKLNGLSAYFNEYGNGSWNGTLVLEDYSETKPAWKQLNGGSWNTLTIGALEGDGTWDGSGSGATQYMKFKVGSAFRGSINLGDTLRSVVFGTSKAIGNNDADKGRIFVDNTATVTIASGKTWTAKNGLEIAGTVNVAADATINGTITLTDASGRIVSGKALTVAKAASLTEYQVKTVESAGTYTYTLEALPPTPGTITIAQGDGAQQVVVTVPVAHAAGQTVTLTVKDKDGNTLAGDHTGEVSAGGQAVITIDGAADTGYTFEASIGGTSLGEGTFFTGIDNVWFGAYAASDTTVNGSWNTKPQVADGQYVINDPEGSRFAVDSANQGDGDGKLAKIVQVVTFTSAIEVADLPAVEDGTVGGLTVAEVAGVKKWMGIVDGDWVALTGTPALDTEYTVTVEYDRRGEDGVFTYKVGEKTLGTNTVDKTTGFSGVTAMGTGKLAYIEATAGAAVPVAEGYTAEDDETTRPIRVDDAFAGELGANKADIQAALNTTPAENGLTVWQAYALGATATEATAGVKPVISGAQTSDTDKMKIVDGFTVREHTGIAVTRTVKTKAVVTDDWSTDEDAEQEADGVSVGLPAEGAKAKYIKIEYSFE